MKCKKCNTENDDSSKFCFQCGSPLKQDNDFHDVILITAIAVIVMILFFCIALGLSNTDSQTLEPTVVEDNSNQDIVAEVTPSSFPVSKAYELAEVVQGKTSGYSVDFEGVTYSKAQCVYILAKSVVMINNGEENGVIQVGDFSYASDSSGYGGGFTVSKSQYIDMCTRLTSYIDSHNQVPNYIKEYPSGGKHMTPNRLMLLSCKALLEYRDTGSLPSSIYI